MVGIIGDRKSEIGDDVDGHIPPIHPPEYGDALLVQPLVPSQADAVLSLAVLGALVVVGLQLHEGCHDVLVVIAVVVFQEHRLQKKTQQNQKQFI